MLYREISESSNLFDALASMLIKSHEDTSLALSGNHGIKYVCGVVMEEHQNGILKRDGLANFLC